MTSFRGAPREESSRQTHRLDEQPGDTFNENEADEILASRPEIPGVSKLIIGICEIAIGLGANFIQVVTSTLGFLKWVLDGKTKADIIAIPFSQLQHDFMWASIVCGCLALMIQVAIHAKLQPIQATWQTIRNIAQKKNAVKEVQAAMSMGSFIFIVALIGDVGGDASFVNMITNDWRFIIIWIVMLSGTSTWIFHDGMIRVSQAFEMWKDFQSHYKGEGTYADERADERAYAK